MLGATDRTSRVSWCCSGPFDAGRRTAARTGRVLLMSDEQRASSKCLSSVPADGDPLPDVGSASVFHDQAVLVAVPGNLGALLSSHSFCHLQGNSKTSGTDNAQVSTRVPGKTPQPRVTITSSSFQFCCHRSLS